MKPKIGVYLTNDVAKLLKLAVRRSGATKSDIVNEALSRLLDPPPEKDPDEGGASSTGPHSQEDSPHPEGCGDHG